MGCGFSLQQKQQPAQLHQRFAVRTQKIDCRKKSLQVSNIILENVSISQAQILDDPQKVQFAKQNLKSHSLFSHLSEEQIDEMVKVIMVGTTPNNQYIFNAGDHGSCFFIVYQGTATIQFPNDKQNQKKKLETGDSFGQLALMYCAKRAASVKASSNNLQYLVLKAVHFKKILKDIKDSNIEKTKSLVERVKMFELLSKKQRFSLINSLYLEKYPSGHVLFQKGEPSHQFYIIQSGEIQIRFHDPTKKDLVLREYDFFGETVFQKNGTRSGSAVTLSETSCLVINQQAMKQCLGESLQNIIFHNLKKWALKSSPVFQNLQTTELDYLALKFEAKHARANDIILQQEQTIDSLYITLEGTINHEKSGKLFFDEYYSAWQNEKYPTSNKILIVQPPRDKQIFLLKNNDGDYAQLKFEKVRDTLITLKQKALKQNLSVRRNSILKGRTSQMSIASHDNQETIQDVLCLDEFQYVKDLGSGQFGDVYLVRDKRTGALFAMKCLSKQKILDQQMVDCAVAEREILSSIYHPRIVGYFNAYQDHKKIYFLLEFIDGVEMFSAIREIGILNKIIARYYFGSLLLAIQYLHSINVIYRDIKPENSLVNSQGKVFLIDLGTAKVLKYQSNYRTDTMIGTPHYMAPQTAKGKGYSFESDLWSLGIVLYEFVCGCLPFAEKLSNAYQVFEEIRSTQLKFPPFVNDEHLKNLIKKLLTKNPIQRASGGFNWIKQSKYYEGFIWDDLENNRIAPPYIPFKFRKSTNKFKAIQGLPLSDFLVQKYQQEAKQESHKEKQQGTIKIKKPDSKQELKIPIIFREWNTNVIE